MISLIIFLSIKTKQSRACACPIFLYMQHKVMECAVPMSTTVTLQVAGSWMGQQVEDNWQIMTSVYIVSIQIQEHCHNVVTTVAVSDDEWSGSGKSWWVSECCPPNLGLGPGRGEEERASCRGNQAAAGAAGGVTSVTLHNTAAVGELGHSDHISN